MRYVYHYVLTKFVTSSTCTSSFALITRNNVSSFHMLNRSTGAHLCMHLCENIKSTSSDNTYVRTLWQLPVDICTYVAY